MTAPIPVETALATILAHCRRLPAESLPLDRARGRVLAGDVVGDVDLPPFDNSAMDGYAVRAAELAGAEADRPVALPVAEVVAAGAEPGRLSPGQVHKIMTGAPLPAGADAVVPVERTVALANGRVNFAWAPREGANIRRAGEDLRRGETAVGDGATVGPAEIALLAAVGRDPLQVTRRPRAMVLSTGDELVPVTATPAPGQLRDSTIHALPAQLAGYGVEVVATRHAVDDPAELEKLLSESAELDLIVTAGGVSMGDRDFVRPVFERLGEPAFWRVAIKPGKPLLFGRLGAALFFGLPGNPVSSMVTADVFVSPAVDALLGRRDGGRLRVSAVVETALRSDPERTEYVRVALRGEAGRLLAVPTGDQSSGRMTSMLGADGYAVFPVGVGRVEPGDAVTVELLRSASR